MKLRGQLSLLSTVFAIWIPSYAESVDSTAKGDSEWNLVWQDEFNGTELDLCKWGKEENNYGGGNGESQHYSVSRKYCYVAESALHIAAYRDAYTSVDGKTQPYTSARIRTLQRGDWTYGKIELRAQMPSGQGMWPAVWLLPSDNVYGGWAASGEIDILESRGSETDRTTSAIHFGGPWPRNTYLSKEYLLPHGQRTDNDFHVYTLEWSADSIVWSFNGVPYHTRTKGEWYSEAAPESSTAPFDQDFHLIVNLAVNGRFFEGTQQSADMLPDSAFPQILKIDYIRVYQQPTD